MRNKKVIIAMSGGIDSSVAAALLKKQEFEVIGVFMKLLEAGRCCTLESEMRARLVAQKLDIPFYVLNFEKEFKRSVVNYALDQEKLGLTPNPCVVCNKEIKFGLLFDKALSLDADYIATGHYVKVEDSLLLKGKDKNKDQSYFLWGLDKKVLDRVIFPVGNYTKPEIVKMAKKFNLPVLDIAESQDVCFNLEHSKKEGEIIDDQGRVVGRHQGIWFYTIGQRKGIGLSGGPYYVIDKDSQKNRLIVSKDEKKLNQKELSFKSSNFFVDPEDKVYNIKIRYRTKEEKGRIKGSKVIFNNPQRAITPGQSVVFYDDNKLIGGGIIK